MSSQRWSKSKLSSWINHGFDSTFDQRSVLYLWMLVSTHPLMTMRFDSFHPWEWKIPPQTRGAATRPGGYGQGQPFPRSPANHSEGVAFLRNFLAIYPSMNFEHWQLGSRCCCCLLLLFVFCSLVCMCVCVLDVDCWLNVGSRSCLLFLFFSLRFWNSCYHWFCSNVWSCFIVVAAGVCACNFARCKWWLVVASIVWSHQQRLVWIQNWWLLMMVIITLDSPPFLDVLPIGNGDYPGRGYHVCLAEATNVHFFRDNTAVDIHVAGFRPFGTTVNHWSYQPSKLIIKQWLTGYVNHWLLTIGENHYKPLSSY